MKSFLLVLAAALPLAACNTTGGLDFGKLSTDVGVIVGDVAPALCSQLAKGKPSATAKCLAKTNVITTYGEAAAKGLL